MSIRTLRCHPPPPSTTIRATVSECRDTEGALIGRALLLRDVTRERRITVELSTAIARRLVEMAEGDRPPAELPSLTPREIEILKLLPEGLSNAAIASRLHVTLNTIASHLKHIYPKIGVMNRSQAASFAVASGLVPKR